MPALCHLCPSYSQGRETDRLAGAVARQINAGPQSQDGQGDGPGPFAGGARTRRRGAGIGTSPYQESAAADALRTLSTITESYDFVRSSAFTAASPRAVLSSRRAIKGRVNAELQTAAPQFVAFIVESVLSGQQRTSRSIVGYLLR